MTETEFRGIYKLKNISFSELQKLDDELKETYELYFEKIGICVERPSNKGSFIAFGRDVEFIPNSLLEEIFEQDLDFHVLDDYGDCEEKEEEDDCEVLTVAEGLEIQVPNTSEGKEKQDDCGAPFLAVAEDLEIPVFATSLLSARICLREFLAAKPKIKARFEDFVLKENL